MTSAQGVIDLYCNPNTTHPETIMTTILKMLAERVGANEAASLYKRYSWAVSRLTVRGETPERIVDKVMALKQEGV